MKYSQGIIIISSHSITSKETESQRGHTSSVCTQCRTQVRIFKKSSLLNKTYKAPVISLLPTPLASAPASLALNKKSCPPYYFLPFLTFWSLLTPQISSQVSSKKPLTLNPPSLSPFHLRPLCSHLTVNITLYGSYGGLSSSLDFEP